MIVITEIEQHTFEYVLRLLNRATETQLAMVTEDEEAALVENCVKFGVKQLPKFNVKRGQLVEADKYKAEFVKYCYELMN